MPGAVAQSEHRDHGRGGACGVKRAGVRRCSCPLCVRPRPECLADAEPTWLQIIRVVFWCLADLYPEIAFFSLREHVYPFLDLHWDAICTEKHKKDNWKKSLQDTLSHADCLESGKSVFGQNGYWRIRELRDPWLEDRAGFSSSGKPKGRPTKAAQALKAAIAAQNCTTQQSSPSTAPSTPFVAAGTPPSYNSPQRKKVDAPFHKVPLVMDEFSSASLSSLSVSPPSCVAGDTDVTLSPASLMRTDNIPVRPEEDIEEAALELFQLSREPKEEKRILLPKAHQKFERYKNFIKQQQSAGLKTGSSDSCIDSENFALPPLKILNDGTASLSHFVPQNDCFRFSK